MYTLPLLFRAGQQARPGDWGRDARLGDLREIEIESKTTDFPIYLTLLAGGEPLVLVNPCLDDTGEWATWASG